MEVFSNNKICKMLGIKYPIFQGGMAWVADASLASAVSNGGGLGIIAGMNSTADKLRTQISLCRQKTDRPFGVNIMLMSRYADEVARAVIEEGITVVTTGAGNPAKYMEDWLKAGIKVIPVIPTVSYAKLMVRMGASAVVCEGCEAGGHVGELTTMALVPQVRDAVDVPILAAGGIADGRGIAAAFMLGADGVQAGTRFLAATECGIHQNYKDKVIKAGDNDTTVTGRRVGHAIRMLKNKYSRDFAAKEKDLSVSDEEILRLGSGALRLAVTEGDLDGGSFMAGQIAGLVKKEQPAAQIIQEMFAEFAAIISGAHNFLA